MSAAIFSDASGTILNGASLSGAIWVGNMAPATIRMPAAWTAAVLTFQTADAGGVLFQNLFDDGGNEVTVTVAASRDVVVDPAMFAGAPVIKIRSGTSGAPVNQGADRILTVIKRRPV